MTTMEIKELASKHLNEMVSVRRALHMHPELSFEEFKTAALVKKTLENHQIPYEAEIFGTGVLATIKGKKPGKTILLRADMDALPMPELVDLDYKSQNDGVMHACGHDGHTAALLGAAMILNEKKDNLSGTIKLMFQPGEESDGGAKPMIDHGILENPKVDAAFALHLNGELEEGKVLVKKGPFYASTDEFIIKIIGFGGHSAFPHLLNDPVVIAAQVINGIQTIISRTLKPVDSGVISCAYIHGGNGGYNITPDEVEIRGTIRAHTNDVRDMLPRKLEEILKGITSAYNASYSLEIIRRFPPLINDIPTTELAMVSLAKIVGEQNVVEANEAVMGAEDFSYICQEVPSSFFNIGVMKDKPTFIHNSKFEWDDNILELAAACFSQIAIDFLK